MILLFFLPCLAYGANLQLDGVILYSDEEIHSQPATTQDTNIAAPDAKIVAEQIAASEDGSNETSTAITTDEKTEYNYQVFPRVKRQCGFNGGCRGGCGFGGCNGGCRGGCGTGCRSGGCGGGGCRGGGCGGGVGGCSGGGCGGALYGCQNPCPGGRLCCDDASPLPCVNCGLARGNFIAPAPIATTCCACCMPTCVPRCINGGGCLCNRFNRLDYYDYFG